MIHMKLFLKQKCAHCVSSVRIDVMIGEDYRLADFVRTLSDNNVDDLRQLVVLFCKLLLSGLDECIVELVLHEVDGATAEAAAHDA